jgi:hypothetical protein
VADDLDALRDVDPVDPAALPSPYAPEAHALFERIVMTDTETRTAVPTQATSASRRFRLAIAAAAVLVAGVTASVALSEDGDTTTTDPGGVADGPGDGDTTTTDLGGVANGPVSPGGASVGRCVELYDLETLTNRETAFDGTVTALDGDTVTFEVNESFRGGSAGTIALGGAAVLGGLSSVGPGVPLEIGARLLVAGDGGFAWSCGFTQPYDATLADQWRDALTQ